MGLRLRKHPNLKRDDHRYIGRTDDPTALEVVRARGARLEDARGRTFIDLQAGWCVGNLGWGHPHITRRLKRFDGPSYVAPSMLYAPWVELARRLADHAPGKLQRAFRATGGTEANECALQIAMAYTGRTKLVSLDGAYHGDSFAAISIGEGDAPVTLPGCKHLEPPLDERALDRLQRLLAKRDVAAFIMEPIVMNLGVEIPAREFIEGARALCDRYGTLLVFDEVACGFGRTGKMFAAEHHGVAPDIMTLAKALTNGAAPLGATLVTAEIADAVRDEMHFYSTFGWQPYATEAALAVLDVWDRDGDRLLANVAARSEQFAARIMDMPWRTEVDLRVKGLALAIGFDDEDTAGELADACRDDGLLIGAEDDKLLLFPPLVIDEATTDEAMDILEHALG